MAGNTRAEHPIEGLKPIIEPWLAHAGSAEHEGAFKVHFLEVNPKNRRKVIGALAAWAKENKLKHKITDEGITVVSRRRSGRMPFTVSFGEMQTLFPVSKGSLVKFVQKGPVGHRLDITARSVPKRKPKPGETKWDVRALVALTGLSRHFRNPNVKRIP